MRLECVMGEESSVARITPDVRSAMDGDADAVAAVWRAHRRWVAAILLAHMPRDSELEDLLQEVALTVVRHISTLKDPAAVKPWLRTVAINAARTAARRRNVRLRLVRPMDSLAAGAAGRRGGRGDDTPPRLQFEAADTSASDEARDRGRALYDMARSLPEKYREPLMLRCIQGLSQRQIAETMDLPETTIETRLARARRMLRERAEKNDGVLDTDDV